MTVSRYDLAAAIAPISEPDRACVMDSEKRIAWVYLNQQRQELLSSWADGSLQSLTFRTKNKEGHSYTVRNPVRLGLVPHRDGLVHYFAFDLDAHEGQQPNTHYDSTIEKFLGIEPLRFHSKGGRGIRQVFFLKSPIPVHDFVAWAKSWGFNRRGRVEIFPKTHLLTHFWLPNEPNRETGGDCYIGGTIGRAIVHSLSSTIPATLTSAALDFLLGAVENGSQNNALYTTARAMVQKGIDIGLVESLCRNGARLCGLSERDGVERTEQTIASAVQSSTIGAAGTVRVQTTVPTFRVQDHPGLVKFLRASGVAVYQALTRIASTCGREIFYAGQGRIAREAGYRSVEVVRTALDRLRKLELITELCYCDVPDESRVPLKEDHGAARYFRIHSATADVIANAETVAKGYVLNRRALRDEFGTFDRNQERQAVLSVGQTRITITVTDVVSILGCDRRRAESLLEELTEGGYLAETEMRGARNRREWRFRSDLGVSSTIADRNGIASYPDTEGINTVFIGLCRTKADSAAGRAV